MKDTKSSGEQQRELRNKRLETEAAAARAAARKSDAFADELLAKREGPPKGISFGVDTGSPSKPRGAVIR